MPVSKVPTTFTAATGTLKFAGIQVGAIQDLSWSENNNPVRVKEIGSGSDIQIVDGITEIDITASRAFLEADLVFTLLKKVDIAQLNLNGINKDQIDDLDKLKQALVGTVLTRGVKTVGLRFNLEVKNAMGETIWTFYECAIASKRARISTGSVIIMDDITIMARYNAIDGNATEIKNI